MEQEKIREVKETLEHNAYFAIEYFPKAGKPKVFKLDDILTVINELESENERLILQYERVKADSEMNCLELKDRIAELEEYIKGNEQDAKAFVNGWHKDLETEIKQFAENVLKFVKEYAFKDRKEIYTNGTILVPLFRVEYALQTGGQDYQQG